MRERDRLSVEPLESGAKHRTVDFVAEAASDVDDAAWVDAEKVSVVSEVVDRAECEAINHRRDTVWIGVLDDVCGLHEFALFESADGASLAICTKYVDTEALLVKPQAHVSHGVGAYLGR